MLPLLYNYEDYYKCLEDNKLYCKVVGKLYPNSSSNEVWKHIVRLETNRFTRDRTYIHRGFCLDKQGDTSNQYISNLSKLRIDRELETYNFTTKIVKLFCTNQLIHSSLDLVVLKAVVILFSIIVAATVLHKKIKNSDNLYVNLLSKFSLQHTWNQITNTEGNEDFRRLKSIQGFRVFGMLYIIYTHTNMLLGVAYWIRFDSIEEFLKIRLVRYGLVADLLTVQLFLFISTFLLTIQIYNRVNRKSGFTLKDVFILIANRFFRLGVVSTIIIILNATSLLSRMAEFETFEWIIMATNACRKNWLSTIFFYNNYLHITDTCNGVTWSNSVDFQMYCMVAILLYITFRYKLHQVIVMAFTLLFSLIIYGTIIYSYQLDSLARANLRLTETFYYGDSSSYYSKSSVALYTSTFSSWSTSFLGMIFGAIYIKTKHLQIENTWLRSCVWSVAFPGFIISSILIAIQEESSIAKFIVGPIIKPLYTLGIGIGILGMSNNFGGIMKQLFESKMIVIISNFTYCVYLTNWLVPLATFSINSLSSEVRILNGIIFFIINVVKCLVVGIILTITIEQPAISIQKILLPQISKKDTEKTN